jgi:putative viral A-type inclusion protein
MILKNNKIIIVLNVIMLLIVTGLSTYAYHKQKSYSNQKIEINNSPVDNTKNSKIALITNSSTNFKNENDLNKKFEIFKKLINDKNEILYSKDDEISSKYNDTISQMKEELKSSIKNTIKENTLDSQALSDAQKVESSKNKLEELKSFVTKNAIDIYENEEQSNEIIVEIDTALNNNVVSQPVIQQSQNYNYTQEVQPQTYQSNQQQATTRSQSTTTRRTTRSR